MTGHTALPEAIVPLGVEQLCLVKTGQLKKSIGTVSQKVLTAQLRDMEKKGLVTRTVYAEVPPRVEYTLTETGYSLKPILGAMWVWGTDYQAKNEGVFLTRAVLAANQGEGSFPARRLSQKSAERLPYSVIIQPETQKRFPPQTSERSPVWGGKRLSTAGERAGRTRRTGGQTVSPMPAKHKKGPEQALVLSGWIAIDQTTTGTRWMFISTLPSIPGTFPVPEYCHIAKS